MTSDEIIVLLGGGAVVVLLWTLIVPRRWLGTDRRAQVALLSVLPFSYPVRRGLLRATPLVAAAFTCGYLTVPLLLGTRAITGSEPTGGALWVAGALALMGLGLGLIGWPLIVLVNWPKLMVPPPFRDDPGAITLWRRAWQLRRSQR